jgi:hypothetical protein
MELGDRTLDIGETLTQTNVTAPIPKTKLTPDGIKRLLFPRVDVDYLNTFKPMFASLDLNDNMEWVVTPNFGEEFGKATDEVIQFVKRAVEEDVWMKFNETLVKVKPTDCVEDVYRKWMTTRGQAYDLDRNS